MLFHGHLLKVANGEGESLGLRVEGTLPALSLTLVPTTSAMVRPTVL